MNVSICTRKFVTHNVHMREEKEKKEVENVIVGFSIYSSVISFMYILSFCSEILLRF